MWVQEVLSPHSTAAGPWWLDYTTSLSIGLENRQQEGEQLLQCTICTMELGWGDEDVLGDNVMLIWHVMETGGDGFPRLPVFSKGEEGGCRAISDRGPELSFSH